MHILDGSRQGAVMSVLKSLLVEIVLITDEAIRLFR